MSNEPNDLERFRKQFRKFFPKLNPSEYQDVVIWQATRKVSIDVIKLDDWLHKEFGQYEDQGYSMRSILTIRLGKECADFVAKRIYV